MIIRYDALRIIGFGTDLMRTISDGFAFIRDHENNHRARSLYSAAAVTGCR
jgi:hypothetical protein